MCAVAKRFLRRRTAAAESHSFFGRESVSICVDQFHFTRNDIRTMLDCFDCYHDSRNLTLSPRAASRVAFWGAHACSVLVAAFCGDELFLNSKLLGDDQS